MSPPDQSTHGGGGRCQKKKGKGCKEERKTTVAVGSMWPSPMDSERDKVMGTLKIHVIPSSEFQLNYFLSGNML